jgi:hypothetical protein
MLNLHRSFVAVLHIELTKCVAPAFFGVDQRCLARRHASVLGVELLDLFEIVGGWV